MITSSIIPYNVVLTATHADKATVRAGGKVGWGLVDGAVYDEMRLGSRYRPTSITRIVQGWASGSLCCLSSCLYQGSMLLYLQETLTEGHIKLVRQTGVHWVTMAALNNWEVHVYVLSASLPS